MKDIERWLAVSFVIISSLRGYIGQVGESETSQDLCPLRRDDARVIAWKSRGWWDFSLLYVRTKKTWTFRCARVCIGRENRWKEVNSMSTDLFLLPAGASWQSKRSDRPEILVRTRLACEMRFPRGKQDNRTKKFRVSVSGFQGSADLSFKHFCRIIEIQVRTCLRTN